MKFNKRKFFRNFLFLILFITLVLLGVYVWKTPEARDNIYKYYSSFIANFIIPEVNGILNL